MSTVEPTVLGHVCIDLGPLIRSHLVRRENRFRVRVYIEGSQAAAFLANSGRLNELMVKDRVAWLTPAGTSRRKTAYDLTLVEHPDSLVTLDSHLPNRLIAKALLNRAIPGLENFTSVQAEVPFGRSRLDFCVADDLGKRCWVEVKSVTLVENGLARFPDAPTARGRRHLRELCAAVEQGDRASVIFVVQRSDAAGFTPHDATDPEFGAALREAAGHGVEVRALSCSVTLNHVCLQREIPVLLDALGC